MDRIEHPCDAEDYLRQSGFSVRVFVDMSEDGLPMAGASLGSIAILLRSLPAFPRPTLLLTIVAIQLFFVEP